MEQDHVATFDAAINIVVFVDDRVELTFAADRHEAKFTTVAARERRELVDVQTCPAVWCSELRGVKRPAANLEFFLRVVDLRHAFKTGNDLANRLSNLHRGSHF